MTRAHQWMRSSLENTPIGIGGESPDSEGTSERPGDDAFKKQRSDFRRLLFRQSVSVRHETFQRHASDTHHALPEVIFRPQKGQKNNNP